MNSPRLDHATVTHLRRVAAEDAAAAYEHNRAYRPGAMERVRRAIRTPLGRMAVTAGGAVLATSAVLGLAQSGSHSSGHEETRRPAAGHLHHNVVATKPNTVTLDREKRHFQASSLVTARTIVKDIAGSPDAQAYKQVYVGVYPGQEQSPEMFSEWDPKKDTMYVSSITQPDGSGVDKFHYIDETLKITGDNAAAINKAAQKGPLDIGDFESALSDPSNVEAISVSVQTPKTENSPVITVGENGTMLEGGTEAYGTTTITNANAHGIVEPFISELHATKDALQHAYRNYQQ